jgi:hypothetical protein
VAGRERIVALYLLLTGRAKVRAALGDNNAHNQLPTMETRFAGALKYFVFPLKLTRFPTRTCVILNTAPAQAATMMIDGLA